MTTAVGAVFDLFYSNINQEWIKKKIRFFFSRLLNEDNAYPNKGESEGYTVKCKEKSFPISNYPLEQTEFYYAQKQARDRLENEKNKVFDYSMFHHRNGITEKLTDLSTFQPKYFQVRPFHPIPLPQIKLTDLAPSSL